VSEPKVETAPNTEDDTRMLAKTKTGRLWIGASAALLCAAVGCNSSSKTHARLSSTAGVSSGTTGGVTSVTSSTTGGVTTSTTGGPPAGVTDDHTNAKAGATPLTMGGAARAGLIQYAGDEDWFSVSMQANVSYTFMTQRLTGGADTILRVFAENGTTLLVENDDVLPGDPSSRVAHTPAVNGTYFIVVLHKSASAATGGYDVRGLLTAAAPPLPQPDDHKNDATTTSTLVQGTARTGTIENAGDLDWFKVALTPGNYTFTTQNLGNGMDTVIDLIDVNGTTVLDTNDDYGNGLASQITRAITVAGNYYISVKDFDASGTGGTYELVLGVAGADDHRNDATTTSVLTLGVAAAGRVESNGDKDWFRVSLVAGTTYTLRTTVTGTDDTILTLFSGASVQLAENDDEAQGVLSSRISFPCTASGTYYLQVRGFSTSTPSYTVTAGP
jgi:hypothetical protein